MSAALDLNPFRSVMARVAASALDREDKSAILICLAYAETCAMAAILKDSPTLRDGRIAEAQKLLGMLATAMQAVKP